LPRFLLTLELLVLLAKKYMGYCCVFRFTILKRLETVFFCLCKVVSRDICIKGETIFCDYRKIRKIFVFEILNGESISVCTRMSVLGSENVYFAVT
jgi:hypothetical protein